MDTDTRSRPELQVWTNYQNLAGHPRTAFRVPSPWSETTPISPKSLPSPMYPSTTGYDQVMRRHERAMVDRLDPRSRRQSEDRSSTSNSLPPIAEQGAAIASRLEKVSVIGPMDPTGSVNLQPLIQPAQIARRQTIAAESRSVLLSGVPAQQVGSLGSAVNRRQSLPATPTAPGRRNSQPIREQLQTWGHVYLGDSQDADILVTAVSLRRLSDPASGDDGQDAVNPGTPKSSEFNFCVRVRDPSDPKKKPFTISRKFDLDMLRSTLPEPAQHQSADTNASARIPRTPVPASRPSRHSVDRRASGSRESRRISTSDVGAMPIRKFSAYPRGPSGADHPCPLEVWLIRWRFLDFEYARSYMPALAALIASKKVPKDYIVDLPLPHPRAWQQTVAYTYTGQGELTDAIKQNILHLGGRV